MTTPDTPPSLAVLYAERAHLAYAMEHIRYTPEAWAILSARYAALQAKITIQAAQWPARWLGKEEER